MRVLTAIAIFAGLISCSAGDNSNGNLGVVSSIYDAFANGDIAAVTGAMDENIIWNEAENFPYADGNPYVGPDAVTTGVFARLGGDWEYWNLSVEDMMTSGDKVIVLGRYEAKNKQTEKEINAQFAHVWTVKDGKAIEFQQYADTAQVQAAMGG